MSDIVFIPGSLRADSSCRAIAGTLAERLKTRATSAIADIGVLPHYNLDVVDDPNVAGFIGQIGAADGVVFVTPEYNYSIPGVLKNAIDWASRPAFASVFAGKPCLVISVSGGSLGGVRAQAHLKYILSGMLARVHIGKEVVIPQGSAKITDGMLAHDKTLAFVDAEMAPFLDSLG